MRKRRLLLGLSAAGVAAATALLGGILAGSSGGPLGASNARAATDQGSLATLLSGFAAGDTVGLVRRLEERVADDPGDGQALATLGLAYQQRARETGDATFYALAGRALDAAAMSGGPEPVIIQGRAALANTRHRFAAGLRLARDASRFDPEDGSPYGPIGDALLDLGRYPEAFSAYDRMAKLSPGLTSYARVAHARELLGRPRAAAEAYELALETGSSVREYVAWTRVQLGNVYFNTGRLDAAASRYRSALVALPGYVHAEAALARIDAARGRSERAIRRLRHVVDALPAPAYVILLGDAYRSAGRGADARRTYALADTIERVFEANGVRTELQTALFDLDRNRDVLDALRRARLAYRASPGIYAEDALAWGLARVGRCAEARAHSVRSLRLGTRDALLYFHRAMIERCLDSGSARAWFARALDANPHFSLRFAPVARAALATGG